MNEESLYRNNSLFNRRDFLRLTGGTCGTMGMGAAMNTLMHQKVLGAISGTGDLNNADDYKALVCVFLFGGNDGMSCFLPTDDLDGYRAARTTVALPETGLNHVDPSKGQYAFHQELPFFRDAYNADNLAVIGNVGTLVETGVTRQDIISVRGDRRSLPPQLFSHNDQQTQWQTSLPGQDSTTGWGGRLGDAARAFNEEARVSINVSVGRDNIFTVGNRSTRLELRGGSVSLRSDGPAGVLQASQSLRDLEQGHLFRKEFANITDRAIESEILLRSVLNRNAQGEIQPGGRFSERPSDILFQQLQSVSQMIANREELGVKRQIFFVNYINFDTHGNQLEGHAGQLEPVNRALELFCDEMDSLGLADNVTAFTTTEFGRSYLANSGGTDHGWGNANFVIGGAVKGGQLYGGLPDHRNLGDPSVDAGSGRWIPEYSTDQYVSTLAKWFGVRDSDLSTVVPNIQSFPNPDIGFMEPLS